MANLYSGEDIFTTRHLLGQKKQNSAQNDHICLMVVLWKFFIGRSPVKDGFSYTGLTVVGCEYKMNLLETILGLSFLPSGCSVGIESLVFSTFGMMLETHMKLHMTGVDFLRQKKLPQKCRKWAKNSLFWICWKFRVYLFLNLAYIAGLHCYVPVRISYFGKIWFLRYELKRFKPIGLQDFQINYISRRKWWNS